jgi:hypothetical protein
MWQVFRGSARPVALACFRRLGGGTPERTLRRYVPHGVRTTRRLPPPRVQSITDTQSGSAASLRDEMGLLPFAATISPRLNPSWVHATLGCWPEACWWRTAPAVQHRKPASAFHLSVRAPINHIRLLFHRRGVTRQFPNRAPAGIQRASPSHKSWSASRALRQWMLPTIERGPPSGSLVSSSAL